VKDTKKISRVYQTLTFKSEKKILDYLASRVFKFVSPDQLSFLALLGALLVAFSYQFTGKSLNYLHLANIGIAIHWFGDSLDGRVAKLRKMNRPLYGHYIDHIMDSFAIVIIFIGISLSPIATTIYWLLALTLALLTFNHIYLKTSVTRVFNLSLNKIGGTEIRILFILFNLLLIFSKNPTFLVFNKSMFLADALILGFSVILGFSLLSSVSKSLWGKEKIQG